MKQQIEENYEKIGIGIVTTVLVAGLAVTTIQNLGDIDSEDSSDPNTVSEELLPESNESKTIVYFFWGDGCPYCAEEKPFLEELDKKHDGLEVKMYEVYNNETNQRIFRNVAEKYGSSARGVPATFIGEDGWKGYNQQIGNQIESKIEECLKENCKSPIN